MSKNLIPQIAKMLGVELGEEFKVVSNGGSERACVLNHDGLLDNTSYVYYNNELFVDLLCGDAKIIKLPNRSLMIVIILLASHGANGVFAWVGGKTNLTVMLY